MNRHTDNCASPSRRRRPAPLTAVLRWADDWNPRQRSWAMFVAALCAVLIFVSIWTVYSASHTYDRYRQVDPNTSVKLDSTTYRILRMRQTKRISDGDSTRRAGANATWVVVDLQATVSEKTETPCTELALVGPAKRSWKSRTSLFNRELPSHCPDKVTVGKPFHYQLIFRVPTKFTDQIFGIGVDDPASAGPITVIRP